MLPLCNDKILKWPLKKKEKGNIEIYNVLIRNRKYRGLWEVDYCHINAL